MTSSSAPLIANVLRFSALIVGFFAFLKVHDAFSAPSVSFESGETLSAAPSLFLLSGILAVSALAMWWMAEIVALLGRIAENTESKLSPPVLAASGENDRSSPTRPDVLSGDQL